VFNFGSCSTHPGERRVQIAYMFADRECSLSLLCVFLQQVNIRLLFFIVIIYIACKNNDEWMDGFIDMYENGWTVDLFWEKKKKSWTYNKANESKCHVFTSTWIWVETTNVQHHAPPPFFFTASKKNPFHPFHPFNSLHCLLLWRFYKNNWHLHVAS
jgi:hypothetical protein